MIIILNIFINLWFGLFRRTKSSKLLSPMKKIISILFLFYCVFSSQISAVAKDYNTISNTGNLNFFVDAGSDKVLDCDNQKTTLDGSVDAALSNYDVLWTTVDGRIVGPDNILNPTVDKPGTYVMTVTNTDTQLTGSASVVVTVADEYPIITIQPYGIINCKDTTVTIHFNYENVSPENLNHFQVSWFNGENGNTDLLNSKLSQNGYAKVKSAGTYYLIIIDKRTGRESCATEDTIVVLGNHDTLVADAGSGYEINCINGFSTLTANTTGHPSGTTYLWTTTDGVIVGNANEPIIRATTPGEYVLNVTHPTSFCVTQDAVNVIERLDPPVINFVNPEILNCNNSTIQINTTGSTQGININYNWHTTNGNIVSGHDTATPTIDKEGVYTLTITDINTGCSTSENIEIFSNFSKTEPAIGQIDTINCLHSSANITLSNTFNPTIEYGWYDNLGIQTSTFSSSLNTFVFKGGDFSVISRNTISGCTDTTSFYVPEFLYQPLADGGNDAKLDCSGNSIILDASHSEYQPGSTRFTWLNEEGQVLLSNSITYETVVAGTYTIQVEDLLSKCVSYNTVTIEPDTRAPQITAGPTQTLTCDTISVVLRGMILSSISNYEVEWTSPTNNEFVGSSTILNPTVNTPGTYTMTVKDLDNHCPSSSSVVIEEEVDEPLANAGSPIDFNCHQEEIILTGQTNVINPIVNWSTYGGAFGSATNALSTTAVQPGVYTLSIKNPRTGCQNSSFVVVRAPVDFPVVDAGMNQVLDCHVENIQLLGTSDITNNVTINWNGPGNIINGNTLQPAVDAEGIYYLRLTNNKNNCTAIDSVFVKEEKNGPSIATFLPIYHNCDNANLSLMVSNVVGGRPPYAYEIIGFEDPSPSNLLENLDAGIEYSISIIDQGGCRFTQNFTIDSIQLPNLTYDAVYFNNEGVGVEMRPIINNSISGNLTYSWYPTTGLSCSDCLTPIANPTQSTSYELTIRNDEGCEVTYYTRIEIDFEGKVFFPNAFSPNGDGRNDFFAPKFESENIAQVIEINIFDRFGNQIWGKSNFTLYDDTDGWDGTFNGQLLNSGVFVYTSQIQFKDGSIKTYSGDVTLLK